MQVEALQGFVCRLTESACPAEDEEPVLWTTYGVFKWTTSLFDHKRKWRSPGLQSPGVRGGDGSPGSQTAVEEDSVLGNSTFYWATVAARQREAALEEVEQHRQGQSGATKWVTQADLADECRHSIHQRAGVNTGEESDLSSFLEAP